jgi:L-cystine transport system substrate-binding protein
MKEKLQSVNNKRIRITALLLTLLMTATLLLSACGASSAATGTSPSASTASASPSTSGKVTTVNVAYSQNGKPTAYLDESGNLTGYDIEALRLVDALLPQYEFNFIGLDQTACFAGLATGKYQIAATNSFYTEERAQKYLVPSENIGASILGLFTSKEKNPDVASLAVAASKKLSLVPILAGDGNYFVVQQFNKKYPDNQVNLQATDDANAFTESFQWVAEGRYDFALVPKQYWDSLVVADDGAFHQYFDKLSYHVFGAVKTWTFLAKGQDQLAADLSAALKQLKDEGKLSELQKKFYNGVDNFTYLNADSQ